MSFARPLTLGALAVALALGCDTPDDDATPRAGAVEASVESAAPASATAGMSDAALASAVRALVPQRTRAGQLRLSSPLVNDPRALPILLERLRGEQDLSVETRAALVEALPRTGADFGAAAVGLLQTEEAPAVRAVLAAGLRRATPEHARAGAALALADADPEVREAGARVVGYLDGGEALADALVAALDDDVEGVRVAAIRSLGALKVTPAFPRLAALLDDGTPSVRLHALRALHRIDAAKAQALPGVKALARDGDPKVAAAARKLGG
ncbi:MAG: HEAT repeat domain-containing protein [Myxococcales bacterium]|nr:HEAT repeat domain-containing protein [Myxococcales bacterium]